MVDPQVAVIGAGPAGIAVALSLRDRSVRPLLIDRAESVGSSWRTRYDVLRLNTGRITSHMPKRRYPHGTPMFPSRDDVVAHLERHANEDGIELRLDTEVDRVDRAGSGWRLRTPAGDIDTAQVVVATGNHNTPVIPELRGADTFTGTVSHSSAYRSPAPYVGKRVLVVGTGSSGMEIVHDLARGGAAKTWLAVRTPPNIMLRSLPHGLPGDPLAVVLYHVPTRISDAMTRRARHSALGDLSQFGLPIPEEGPFSRMRRVRKVPTVVDMEVIDAIRDGSIEVVPTIAAFYGCAVQLAGDRVVQPDAVIFATGYRTGLESLVGHLGVLDERGVPVTSGVKPAATGLRFVGFTARPGFIGSVARQSRWVARRIVREMSAA